MFYSLINGCKGLDEKKQLVGRGCAGRFYFKILKHGFDVAVGDVWIFFEINGSMFNLNENTVMGNLFRCILVQGIHQRNEPT